ncbi:MAG: sulfite exporter TauE/SafE family protein [Rhodospirillales bacterium]
MQIYLPIAEISVDALLLFALGAGVGVLSGMFGVGGGFLMTPLLLFIGVPAAVAVGSEANQVVAASVSGALAHWRRRNIDVKMGLLLLVGGFVGSTIGVWIFSGLQSIGQVEFVVSLSYMILLGVIGTLMVMESVRALLRSRNPAAPRRKLHQHNWMHGLPLKTRFRRSKLYISALLPIGIGVFVGVLAAIMGVGGGFIMVPAMIYLLGMPTSVVVGTSLFQIIFVTANVTFLQAYHNQTVDLVLALILMVGGVIGAQIGTVFGTRLRGEQLRALLGLIVLGVGLRMAWSLFATPDDLFTLGGGGHR